MHPCLLPRHRLAAPLWRTSLAALLCLGAGTLPAQPAAPDGDDFAEQVLHEVNHYRQARQLPALRQAPWLATLAGEHSAHMARLGQLSHAGFQDRFLRARRQTCVENLAAGYSQARRLVAGWRASDSHHQNLLDARLQEVGVASVNGHVTWLACSAGGPAGR
ncbi:MAG: CAP domain-containing protein [Pseudomonadota bacterium]